ncbi:MAG: glycosyltransferase family 2 protein [bacterium]
MEELTSRTSIRLSVVIPYHNQGQYLSTLLGSLEKEFHHWHYFEVVMVDDASQPELERELRGHKFSFPLRTFRLEHHNGASIARNRGAELAEGEIILFLDGDVSVEEGCVKGHWLSHTEGKNQTELPHQLYKRDIHPLVIVGNVLYPQNIGERGWVKYLERSGPAKYLPGTAIPGRLLRSGHMSISRSFFLSVGGFDDQELHYGEDIDLGIRLEERGAKLIWAPHLRVIHHHIRSLPEVWWLCEEFGERSLPQLLQKHPFLERIYGVHLPKRFGLLGIVFQLATSPFFTRIFRQIALWGKSYYLPQWMNRYLLYTSIYQGYRRFVKTHLN